MPHSHSKHINKATQVDFLGYLCYNKIILIIKVDKCYLMIPYNKKLVSNAKSLRKNMTPEEKRLWYDFLKRLPLNVRRQHNIGNYIVDFYIASKKVVIEIDGIQHTALENKAADTERDQTLALWGITVLRYSNISIHQNFNDVVADILKNLNLEFSDLKQIKKHLIRQPSAAPSPAGEGGPRQWWMRSPVFKKTYKKTAILHI